MTENVTIKPDQAGPTLEEEAAALDAENKVGESEPKLAGEEQAQERPEWLPEKFATPADMAKAYAELEKTLSKGSPEDTQGTADEAAENAVEEAGLDMAALSAEYAEKGELAPESLEALKKVGITPDMVEAYIAGQSAQSEALRASLLEPVGSEEAYNEIIGWAADNLSEAEISAFNGVLEGGDVNAAKMAIENLNTKYVKANGAEPARQLSGKASSSGSSGVYESTADLMKDMGNPEYAKNPAFRAKVEAKLSRSSIL